MLAFKLSSLDSNLVSIEMHGTVRISKLLFRALSALMRTALHLIDILKDFSGTVTARDFLSFFK